MATGNPFQFLKESLRNFRTTGALAPSSRFLARGIARQIPRDIPEDFKILEVGAGTGAITVELARRLNGRGHLACWELSPDFCQQLRTLIETHDAFKAMDGHLDVHEGDVLKLPRKPQFDMIVSGLPFNCFHPDEVREFLEHFRGMLQPNGLLVWFEYVAIRKIQQPFVGKARREQLKGISEVMRAFLQRHQHGQEIIPMNFPPARIRHLRFG